MLSIVLTNSLGTMCGRVRNDPTAFCGDVSWNASLPLSVSELDRAARSDYQIAVETLGRPGKPLPSELCLESWRALQCASKFPKCSSSQPPQKVRAPSPLSGSSAAHAAHCYATNHKPRQTLLQVCRTLCYQFAHTCNTSDSVLVRCADGLLYDDPPCTDYVSSASAEQSSVFRGLELHGVSVEGYPAAIASSPVLLFRTATGLPIFLGAILVGLHLLCCAAQSACGGVADDDVDAAVVRGAMRDMFATDTSSASGDRKQLLFAQSGTR
jgi:hypothetical protein